MSNEVCKFFEPESGACVWQKELGLYRDKKRKELSLRLRLGENVIHQVGYFSRVTVFPASLSKINGETRQVVCRGRKPLEAGGFEARIYLQETCNAYYPKTGIDDDRIDEIRREIHNTLRK